MMRLDFGMQEQPMLICAIFSSGEEANTLNGSPLRIAILALVASSESSSMFRRNFFIELALETRNKQFIRRLRLLVTYPLTSAGRFNNSDLLSPYHWT
jgi:hypothetical protein